MRRSLCEKLLNYLYWIRLAISNRSTPSKFQFSNENTRREIKLISQYKQKTERIKKGNLNQNSKI